MKIEKMELVTRTYCDMCKADITREGSYGYTDNDGCVVDICSGRPIINGKQGDVRCETAFLAHRAYLAGDDYPH